jgi:hypothetical protein
VVPGILGPEKHSSRGCAAACDAGELTGHPPVHVVAADVPGHGGQRGAASVTGEPECVLDALGQALDVERVARHGVAQFVGRAGELGQDE